MSIDLSAIYRNPRIPEGYYFAKVEDVIEQNLNDEYPLVQVRLKLWDETVRGVQLASILHPTAKCRFFHENFTATFRIDAPHCFAKGKWGCIEVYDANYQGTCYSAVKFIYQKADVKRKVIALEIKDQQGKVEW